MKLAIGIALIVLGACLMVVSGQAARRREPMTCSACFRAVPLAEKFSNSKMVVDGIISKITSKNGRVVVTLTDVKCCKAEGTCPSSIQLDSPFPPQRNNCREDWKIGKRSGALFINLVGRERWGMTYCENLERVSFNELEGMCTFA